MEFPAFDSVRPWKRPGAVHWTVAGIPLRNEGEEIGLSRDAERVRDVGEDNEDFGRGWLAAGRLDKQATV
jgi:hypothetical protein